MSVPHVGFRPEEKEALVQYVQDIALSCGQTIHDDEISFPGLKKDDYSHDCLCLESGWAKDYAEFPLEISESTGARIPKPDLHATVLGHLRQRIWMDLKDRCLQVDDTPNAHRDGTINTIWNERIVVGRPHLQSGMSVNTEELKITTILGQGDARTEVRPESITIPHHLPQSIVHGGLCRLGDILDMPDCGDPDVQAKFLDQYVFSIDATDDGTKLRTGISRHPVMGEDGVYPWRIMRSIAHVRVTPASCDPLAYDVERDIAEYLRENSEFFDAHGMPEDHYRRGIAA